MSHRSQRKGSRQQKQQKLQLQEHLPRQRVQRRPREQRDQRQWQERRAERGRREERREEQREERERERSREAVQETIDNMYTENQTDLPQPFRQEPQVERFPKPHREQLSEPPREQLPEPQVEHIQEIQVEHIQEPRVQRLPPLSNFKFWVWLLSLGFCLGYWIGRAVAQRAPRATEAFHLAIRVFALEVGRFAFSSLNQLARSLTHVVSTYGGFWEFVVLLVMLTMYLVREEYVPLSSWFFSSTVLSAFVYTLSVGHCLANHFL